MAETEITTIENKIKPPIRGTSEHYAWKAMRARCNNPKHYAYARYGGRGITVCDRWNTYELFLDDLGLRPSPSHSIDRIDNSKGYSPDNCRWADKKEQGRNRRTCRTITHNGETLCHAEWAERIGISSAAFHRRLALGWTKERAITVPKK